MPAPPTALLVLQGLGSAASLIAGLVTIFDDDHEQLNEQLNEILTSLQELKVDVVTGIRDILTEIDGIKRQIDEDVAFDNMTLADRALFSDLVIFNDKQEAMGNSFQASKRLFREDGVVFASSFMYVVNIRLAVLKDFDPNYYCDLQFQQEFDGYIEHLEEWISQINQLIYNSHTVEVKLIKHYEYEFDPPLVLQYWMAQHLRNGSLVNSFCGPPDDTSQAARDVAEQKAEESRRAGIETDRDEFGVVHMENTVAAWKDAFEMNLRLAVVRQLLNRAPMAIDHNPDGLMLDGRILRGSLSMRKTLMEVLLSREFRRLVNAFLEQDGDLARLVVQRLFQRDPKPDEISLLKEITGEYGHGGFISALVYSNEYQEKYGDGIPKGVVSTNWWGETKTGYADSKVENRDPSA